jgi:hypothetical protein
MPFCQILLEPFTEDEKGVSTKYLLDLLHEHEWVVQRMYLVSRYNNSQVRHYVIVLASGYIICDCVSGINLGIPCRHVFAILYKTDALFHISLFNPR